MSLIRLSYQTHKGLRVPIIVIGISGAKGWHSVEAYVDSGATYSVFSDRVASRIELEYKTGKKIFIRVGDGGLIPAYLHDLTIQLGTEKFIASLASRNDLGWGSICSAELAFSVDSRSALMRKTGL